MAVNNLTFEQSAAFLNDLYGQATGLSVDNISPINAGNFVSVAQTVLKTGYDNVINSISQVLGRTIFSVRPYSAKFKGIDVSEEKWGAITRKINYVDKELENDDRMALVDGQAVDPWRVNKPVILQTNFYGATQYQKSITIFRDQLDAAFSSADEFGRFIGGLMQNIEDQLEQVREEEARACLANLIGGVAASGNTMRYIDVLATYNDMTAENHSTAELLRGDNFVTFTKWLYSFINDLTRQMSERSVVFHQNVNDKPILRHTPPERLKAYMTASIYDQIESIALPSVFGADRMKMIDWEPVTYWQSIKIPEAVQVTPTYLAADGTLTTSQNVVAVPYVVGVLFDEEAAGITRMSTWQAATPFNPRGGYTNIFWHFTQKMWNDFTENAVVLYMGID